MSKFLVYGTARQRATDRLQQFVAFASDDDEMNELLERAYPQLHWEVLVLDAAGADVSFAVTTGVYEFRSNLKDLSVNTGTGSPSC